MPRPGRACWCASSAASISSDADANTRSPAIAGYTKGVPMGGDLGPAPAGKAPTFLVAALKDPIGANLDRYQIIKGWLDAAGEVHEKVYDVAWSGDRKPGADGKLPPVGNTVDVPNATWTNTIGAPELIAVWKDPDFDPAQRAFYYGRVIEIPTPRWTAYDAKYFGVDLAAGSADDDAGAGLYVADLVHSGGLARCRRLGACADASMGKLKRGEGLMKLRKLMAAAVAPALSDRPARPLPPMRLCLARTRSNTRHRPAGPSRSRRTAGSPGSRATSVPAGRTTHVDESFGDILSNLDIGLMGVAEARYERFGVFTDLVYARLSESADTPFGILASSVDFNHADPDVDGRRRISPARPAGCQHRRFCRFPAVLHQERARLQPTGPARRSRGVATGDLGRSDCRIEGALFRSRRSST